MQPIEIFGRGPAPSRPATTPAASAAEGGPTFARTLQRLTGESGNDPATAAASEGEEAVLAKAGEAETPAVETPAGEGEADSEAPAGPPRAETEAEAIDLATDFIGEEAPDAEPDVGPDARPVAGDPDADPVGTAIRGGAGSERPDARAEATRTGTPTATAAPIAGGPVAPGIESGMAIAAGPGRAAAPDAAGTGRAAAPDAGDATGPAAPAGATGARPEPAAASAQAAAAARFEPAGQVRPPVTEAGAERMAELAPADRASAAATVATTAPLAATVRVVPGPAAEMSGRFARRDRAVEGETRVPGFVDEIRAADARTTPTVQGAAASAAMLAAGARPAFLDLAAVDPLGRPLTEIGAGDRFVPLGHSVLAAPASATAAATAIMAASVAPPTAQIAEAARNLREGTLEITLSPRELGRVQMTLSPTETGHAIVLSVERDETLHLLRRHAAELQDAFAAMDLGSLDISFRERGSGSSSAGDNAAATPAPIRRPDAATAMAEPVPARGTTPTDRLDLRV